MERTARYLAVFCLISILFVPNTLSAARILGPHGGRIFKSGKTIIEFNVDKTLHPHIFRLNAKNKTIAMDSMRITMRALLPRKAITIDLSRTTEGLGIESNEIEHMAGTAPMPGSEEYPVEITAKLGKLSKKFRFQYIDGFCAECGLPAFNCTCPK